MCHSLRIFRVGAHDSGEGICAHVTMDHVLVLLDGLTRASVRPLGQHLRRESEKLGGAFPLEEAEGTLVDDFGEDHAFSGSRVPVHDGERVDFHHRGGR